MLVLPPPPLLKMRDRGGVSVVGASLPTPYLLELREGGVPGQHIPSTPLPHLKHETEGVSPLRCTTTNPSLARIVRQRGFLLTHPTLTGLEHDSWEYKVEVHALKRVANVYHRHPAAPRQIQAIIFLQIPFQQLSLVYFEAKH